MFQVSLHLMSRHGLNLTLGFCRPPISLPSKGPRLISGSQRTHWPEPPPVALFYTGWLVFEAPQTSPQQLNSKGLLSRSKNVQVNENLRPWLSAGTSGLPTPGREWVLSPSEGVTSGAWDWSENRSSRGILHLLFRTEKRAEPEGKAVYRLFHCGALCSPLSWPEILTHVWSWDLSFLRSGVSSLLVPSFCSSLWVSLDKNVCETIKLNSNKAEEWFRWRWELGSGGKQCIVRIGIRKVSISEARCARADWHPDGDLSACYSVVVYLLFHGGSRE